MEYVSLGGQIGGDLRGGGDRDAVRRLGGAQSVRRTRRRIGPNRAGPFGILQSFADALGWWVKEDIIPRGADKALTI